MNIKVIIHKEVDGYWGEVPSIPGCASQGDTYEELIENLSEAIEGCLSIDIEDFNVTGNSQILELAI